MNSEMIELEEEQADYNGDKPLIVNCDDCMQSTEICLETVKDIATLFCNTRISLKQIDMQLHKIDLQFQSMTMQIEANLEMYKSRLPIVSSQLNSISNAMTKILDKVLEMDAEDEVQMTMKFKYIDMIDNYVNNLSSMIVKLL